MIFMKKWSKKEDEFRRYEKAIGLLNLKKEEKVLDAGCGSGKFLNRCLKKGTES